MVLSDGVSALTEEKAHSGTILYTCHSKMSHSKLMEVMHG